MEKEFIMVVTLSEGRQDAKQKPRAQLGAGVFCL
jgi:hypothetical protein